MTGICFDFPKEAGGMRLTIGPDSAVDLATVKKALEIYSRLKCPPPIRVSQLKPIGTGTVFDLFGWNVVTILDNLDRPNSPVIMNLAAFAVWGHLFWLQENEKNSSRALDPNSLPPFLAALTDPEQR